MAKIDKELGPKCPECSGCGFVETRGPGVGVRYIEPVGDGVGLCPECGGCGLPPARPSPAPGPPVRPMLLAARHVGVARHDSRGAEQVEQNHMERKLDAAKLQIAELEARVREMEARGDGEVSAARRIRRTVLTLYGDSGGQTSEAAKALEKTGIPFRVWLTNDHPGVPVLSLPFGEIDGLKRIRAFCERAPLSEVASGDGAGADGDGGSPPPPVAEPDGRVRREDADEIVRRMSAAFRKLSRCSVTFSLDVAEARAEFGDAMRDWSELTGTQPEGQA